MKLNRSVFLAIIAATAGYQLLPVPAGAHHSTAPFYDQTRTVVIRGVVTKWTFVNPHPFLYVDVTDEQGETQEWVIEFSGPVRLQKMGWSAEFFKPGEIITATGHPPRAEGTYGMFYPEIVREDGTVIPSSQF
ncbi:MAG: hypothetical protein F4053_17130 [Proteobacteria bacterium]|nr:hypothetical protein [Pseudomonadota bacterium]MYJ97233.1 hypothetical protein [Pseudomonadota bacterium]